MKRLLVLNYEFPPLGGGAANATYNLLKEFSKNSDLEIDLVTSSIDSFRIENFADNITIHYLDIGKGGNLHYQSEKDLLRYSFQAYRYIKKKQKEGMRFDICHAFFGIPSGYIAMKLGIPYIVSLRGSDVPFYNKRFKVLDTLVFKRLSIKIWKNAKAVIANSEALKELAQTSAPHQKIDVICNGVDTEFFTPATQPHISNTIRIISTGRLIERKGYTYLIKALSGLENIELCLIGDGNIKEALAEQAANDKVTVNFLGNKNREEIKTELQSSDVFILPSLNEGMSNSLLEAMAVGLPVIVTDTGGSAELVSKENGITVPKADIEALREAVIYLLSDREKLVQMGNTSREKAESMSWVNMVSTYKAYYI